VAGLLMIGGAVNEVENNKTVVFICHFTGVIILNKLIF